MLWSNYCELLVQRSLCWTLGNIAESYTKFMQWKQQNGQNVKYIDNYKYVRVDSYWISQIYEK